MAVRLNSPLYEDGPWLKDPLMPDLFRNRQIGVPSSSKTTSLAPQSSAKGGSRRVDPNPSVTSVHTAHKSNQYDDSGKRTKRGGRG
jgi:hypothetical protein